MAQEKSSAGSHNAHPYAQRQRLELRLLEERYRHELMDDEERQGLRDRIHHLRRHLGS